MKGVSNESSNTDKMRQHQLRQAKQSSDAARHEDVDLMVCTDLIDESRSMSLNGSSGYAQLVEVLAANPEDKAMVSDVDQEMMLKIFFKEKVNLSSVVLRFSRPPKAAEGEEEIEACKPRLVKLYCNRGDMDFGDTADIEPSGMTVVEDSEATEAKITCLGHRFQRLESLVVFIEEGSDPEATCTYINRLSIVGHQAQSYHSEYK
mmetsp:Transcript_44806/g.115963  ORF Transcript_44806/g.115963 Transcript_44806/m.115963 type:complete len:205 (+) Transcript_44806:126-740(+)